MDTEEKFYLAKKGQSEPIGPFSLPALQSMAKAGMLSADYLYATDGMSSWLPITGLPGLETVKSAYKGSRPSSHLVLSILLTCCCFPPTALVAVYYAQRVDKLYDSGDIAAARNSADSAAMWCMITLFFGVIAWLCFL